MRKRNVGVVGLGLIGGSLCKALKAADGYHVLGADQSQDVVDAALADGALDGALDGASLGACDILLIALYPQRVIDYVRQHAKLMKKGAIVMDMAGVKTRICRELSGFCAERGVRFIGGHPMAGIEKSGYQHSFVSLFEGATMLLCRDQHTEESALKAASALVLHAGFGEVKIVDPAQHDAVIAYTSQLAHIASSAYVKSPTLGQRKSFSAGSYKDLTRVAKLHAGMWTELFLENRGNLLFEIDELIGHLAEYRAALQEGDEDGLYRLLDDGAKRKIWDEERET
ncbi:MAG: prephenate dehydrogenase [Firmicutes bacterium]|nr:prephenate dehydrogenase [Bacillota bacterium]